MIPCAACSHLGADSSLSLQSITLPPAVDSLYKSLVLKVATWLCFGSFMEESLLDLWAARPKSKDSSSFWLLTTGDSISFAKML